MTVVMLARAVGSFSAGMLPAARYHSDQVGSSRALFENVIGAYWPVEPYAALREARR
jgi:hypothetical protein